MMDLTFCASIPVNQIRYMYVNSLNIISSLSNPFMPTGIYFISIGVD